ncbi:AsmA family protein [Atopomonas sediminilitoris]|uniref:AsmA family protein n=1 Tax=Atopomonas sediminilitoris TaxID=2919919 RepID=UPI001F4EE7B4|nr:AsmA family protein [Atopomonas sediminilitoris]MCJ8168382.1 AsmA family protein [Atopomonas sediminilitoris]
MKSLSKLLALLLVGLLLMVIGLGFALTHLFDPNDYKDDIRALARDKAGIELALNGDLGWSLFPWLGLEIHDASVASLQAPQAPLADVKRLGFSVRVLPLLRKEVQMSAIRVDGLTLNLERNQQGQGNWETVGKPANAATPSNAETSSANSSPAADSSKPPVSLNIDSLSINDAQLNYRDAKTGEQFSVENLQLSTGAVAEGQRIPLEMHGFFSMAKPLLRARADLKGGLRFDLGLKRFAFEDLHLQGEASGEPLNGKTLTFTAQGQLLLDQSAQLAQWTGLQINANQLKALGEVTVKQLDKSPKLSGSLSLANFDARAFIEGLGQTLPPMQDGNSLRRVELFAQLEGSDKHLRLDDLKFKLDDSQFTGTIGIASFAKQALRFDLNGDKLNLDNYLPPKSEAQTAEAKARKAQVKDALGTPGAGTTALPDKPTTETWSDEPLLPLEALRKLDIAGSVTIKQLTVDGIPLDSVNAKLKAKQGVLTLEQFGAGVFGGNVGASAKLDAQSDTPTLSISKEIKGIAIEQVLKARDQEQVIKGSLFFDTQLTARGNSLKRIINSLNGNAQFSLREGVLVGANLEQQLCEGIALLNRKALSAPIEGRDTVFQQLGGTLRIKNGIATNRDLKANLPGLSVAGEGDIDLRVLGIDYLIKILIEGDRRDMPDEACQVNERFAGIEWPLRCRGPIELGARACRLDQEGMGKITAQLAGKKLTDKLEEKLGDKVSPELKDALKGLFGR